MSTQNLAILKVLLTKDGTPVKSCKLGYNVFLALCVVPTEQDVPEAFPIDNIGVENSDEIRFMVTTTGAKTKPVKSICPFPPGLNDSATFILTPYKLGECNISIAVLRAEVVKYVEEYKFTVSK